MGKTKDKDSEKEREVEEVKKSESPSSALDGIDVNSAIQVVDNPAYRGDFQRLELKPLELPSIDVKQNDRIIGSDVSVNDLTSEKADESMPKDWREWYGKLRAQETADEMDEERLRNEQEKRDKAAKWSKGFASIGDAVSAVANLAGTAHWGRSAEQSSGAAAINEEMKTYRDKYTKNMNEIRDRLQQTRTAMLNARKSEMNERLTQQKLDIQNKREDRMAVKDALWAQFKAIDQELKARQLDINESKVNAWIDQNAQKLQNYVDKFGSDAAIAWARIAIMEEQNNIRKEAADRKAESDAQKKVTDSIVANYSSYANKLIKGLFGDKIDSHGYPKGLTEDEKAMYDEIYFAKTKEEKKAIIEKYSNHGSVASFYEPKKEEEKTGSSSSSSSTSQKKKVW